MGAEQFFERVKKGAPDHTAEQAFRALVDDAQYMHGHGGYTGTIAEKSKFVEIKTDHPLTEAEAYKLADQLLRDQDPRVDDKWGPAGCIAYDDPEHGEGWYFFGWASS